MRGVELALKEYNYTAGGKKIELIKGSSNATPDSAVNAARKLVEQDKVQILIGPLSGDEGIAVKNYAKNQPGVTFLNGSSAAQATTLKDPAPNFYRFSTDGAQWQAGLGTPRAAEGLQEGRHHCRRLLLPVLPGAGLHDRVLQGRRPGGGQILGADRQQGLLIDHRQDPRRRRRGVRGAGRRRCGQLPDPVRAVRRRQAAGGGLHHGGPDGAQLQRQAPRIPARHRLGRPHRRQLRRRRHGRNSSPTTRRPSRMASRRRHCSRTRTTSTPRPRSMRSTWSRAICPTTRRPSARRSRP